MDTGLKKVVFITGTRADFGKLKPLIACVDQNDALECSIFVTGMHMLYRYGMTVDEVHKAGFTNIFTYMNQVHGEPMEMVLANTISGLSRYVHEYEPDLIIVHGDRVEAMAGATVGALRNILVGHVEGGELSGTVDELIRHSVTKLAHIHFVANKEAEQRLRQLGEAPGSIHIIGSPDIDIMLSDQLPDLPTACSYYDIPFDRYSIVLYHSVTTEPDLTGKHAREFVDALLASRDQFIVIYPNNDTGSDVILQEYSRLRDRANFKIFPSLRFELFLTLLKHASYIVGNSSAGIHEAPVFGVPTVNIGSRQQNRFSHDSIISVKSPVKKNIQAAMTQAAALGRSKPSDHFGNGESTNRFISVLEQRSLWETPTQKVFQSAF